MWSLACLLAGLATASAFSVITAPKCRLSNKLVSEIASYRPVVKQISEAVRTGAHKGKTWEELAAFVDKFGNRISGSENLENAIDYMLDRSIEKGLDNVHGEPVTVPHWVRGGEEAKLLSPREKPLSILGLGGSVATPPEGITAEAIVVRTFDELEQQKSNAKGKIVVFAEKWTGYGETVEYRQYAASRGAAAGAVATLVRSVTPFSINSPHTGWQDYQENVTRIPTACITVEDAEMMLRMFNRGDKLEIFLRMEAKNLDPVTSRNSVVEVVGASEPEKVVVLSGHLDSWDVGTGAMDDGGGAFISWYSLVLLRDLGLTPRRTLRTIMWTGEEEGLIGATAYAKAHQKEKEDLVLLMESDIGTFAPSGIDFYGNFKAECIMREVVKLFDGLNATTLNPSDDVGSDIMVWFGEGIPLASLKNKNERYFWFHHSNGDSMVVEDPAVLDTCTALWASTAYIVADLSQALNKA